MSYVVATVLAMVEPDFLSATRRSYDVVAAEYDDHFRDVDGVHIEVDRDSPASGGRQPVLQWLSRPSQLVGAEGLDAPLGDVRKVILGPFVQPDQSDPFGADGGRKQPEDVRVPMSGQRATAMAWTPEYALAGVPMSGWESIHRIARSSP